MKMINVSFPESVSVYLKAKYEIAATLFGQIMVRLIIICTMSRDISGQYLKRYYGSSILFQSGA